MDQNSPLLAAAVVRWTQPVMALARKAPSKVDQPMSPGPAPLRAHDDYTPRARRADSWLDLYIFLLGLTILADPYRTFVR